MSESQAADFVKLLEYLKAARAFDFSGYKMSSLMRRVQKRMREAQVGSYSEYSDYLEVHPQEFGPLFDTVLINVTSFFRDAPAWQYLAEHILPRILEERLPERPLRVWSAGCASGEEAYTIAMLLVEAIGEDDFRRNVKIYATDADESALTVARQGSFDDRRIAGVPRAYLEKYFDHQNHRYVFRTELRRCLIFGRHDLIQDAAISRLDLLICRNTLMYFNTETQEKILARFHFALKKTGFLFLGKAETLLAHNNSFKPVDLKHRLFTKAANGSLRDRLLAWTPPAMGSVFQEANGHLRLREATFETAAIAQVSIDRQGYLVLANERARRLFGLSSSDLGKLFQDLALSYRPIELRSHIEVAHTTRNTVQVKEFEWRNSNNEVRYFEVQIVPLLSGNNSILGTSISFIDYTQAHQLRSDLERTNQELETAYEELQSANEELETTNEELQSTVEELETTNEELQSANEELETMNEELQSTNEELRAMNEQLQRSSDELNEVNGCLGTILSSLRSAVVVLDRSLNIKIWSEKAQDLWGLRSEEVLGLPFLELDIGLPVRELKRPIRACMNGNRDQEIEIQGINRRGKGLLCRVHCTPQISGREVEGVILLMEEAGGAAASGS